MTRKGGDDAGPWHLPLVNPLVKGFAVGAYSNLFPAHARVVDIVAGEVSQRPARPLVLSQPSNHPLGL